MTEKELRMIEIQSIRCEPEKRSLWEARFRSKIIYFQECSIRPWLLEKSLFLIEYVFFDAYVLCQNFTREEWKEIHQIYEELEHVTRETYPVRKAIYDLDPEYYKESMISHEYSCSHAKHPFSVTACPAPEILDDRKNLFDVILIHHGEQKIPVVKVIMKLVNLGLKCTCDIINALPYAILTEVSRETALNAKDSLEKAGGVVLIR